MNIKCLNWWLRTTCSVDSVTKPAVAVHFPSHHASNTMACIRQLHKRTNNVTSKKWNFQLFKGFAAIKKSDWQSLVVWLLYNQGVIYRNRLKKKFQLVNKNIQVAKTQWKFALQVCRRRIDFQCVCVCLCVFECVCVCVCGCVCVCVICGRSDWQAGKQI